MSLELSLSVSRLVATAQGNLAAGTGGITSSIATSTGQVVNFANGVLTNVSGNGVGISSPINADYFSNLEASIGTAKVCAELQAQVDTIFSMIQSQVNDVKAQLAALFPILALLSAPTNPTEVITWIENFITGFLTPYVIPYTTFTAQLVALTAQIASLTSAIEAAEAGILGCSIVIPPITGI